MLMETENYIEEVVGRTTGNAVIVKWKGKARKFIHNPRYLRKVS